jgi:hypothetical protein
MMIEHLTAHKGATVAARPAFGEPAVGLKERLARGEFGEPFFVKVDADGKAQGAFADKECSSAVRESYVETLLSDLLYVPALENGKPVAGVARVQLGQLLN